MNALRRRAGQKTIPLYARKIRTVTGLALAEIPDSEIHTLGDQERTGLILEWSKGKARCAKIRVKPVDRYGPGLCETFDWIPAAKAILNGGHDFRVAEPETMDEGMIIKFRKQA